MWHRLLVRPSGEKVVVRGQFAEDFSVFENPDGARVWEVMLWTDYIRIVQLRSNLRLVYLYIKETP